ncbi:Predicted NTP pyrophosphohydrolase, NUDIX family [Prauserella marina]|uniref:Predicted NTP pyrophosphohydrolase, NUDIX family n=1 Tax=Prauserella marina TaxID=530584 RepID=A0A1G6VFS2_9PSEU|nr:putative NUDIX family NTP pyrophosphohydrolase [Prauserella marina]SDD51686.1 Predicted NTP pyrophosphohydrolase, NUDIX family [Prauserella marina]
MRHNHAVAAKHSAGILLFRGEGERTEVLLGHMGGPFWARKDDGAWSIPKGECDQDEDPLTAARREFEEELGIAPPSGEPRALGEVRQSGGKLVTVWALEGDLDPGDIVPGTFRLEWPRGSGRYTDFPEIDRAGWFGLTSAKEKLVKGQRPFIDRLADLVA